MRKILLPTDFSENSSHAISYAIALFGADASYTLINVIDRPRGGDRTMISLDEIMEKDAVAGLEKQQKAMNAAYADQGISFATHYEFGTLQFVVEQMHETDHADVVVLGTTGASGLKELLVGSNASEVIQNVKCPVICVPMGAPVVVPTNIVLASDLKSLSGKDVLRPLVNLATRVNAQVTVVNVCENDETAVITPDLSSMLPGVNASFKTVVNESASEGIDKAVKELDGDLLVMVPRTVSWFQSLFQRSVTKRMSMHTTVPLLSLRD